MHVHGRLRLLNPGPVTLTEGVRQAQLGPDICHREPEYAELQNEVRHRLARVYPAAADTHTAVLIAGSGTAAVEAMIGSLVPRTGRVLVIANGVYGERIASMVTVQGKRSRIVQADWTAPVDLDEIDRALDGNGDLTHVAMIHHETTTGRLNDIAAIGTRCRQRGLRLLLDTVSSFGGEAIEFDEWNLEACAASANKCLHGVPGVSFVLVREATLASEPSAATSIYLDLHAQHAAQHRDSTAFTPAVQSLYALREALRELELEGGWRARHQRYARRSGRLREGLLALGFELLLDDAGDYGSTLTAFRLPPALDFDTVHAHARRAGFVIYPGQQALLGSIFRLAVMGELVERDVDEFVATVAELIEG
jgi:2-aminoethylphosphonate-pyruvate transaminase